MLASGSRERGAGICLDLLSEESPAEHRVLQVAYDHGPGEIVENWRRQYDQLPESMAVICPEHQRQRGDLPEGVHTTHVRPDDLTGVTIAVTRYLERWSDGDAPITGCLDSFTSLLQHADLQRAFRFLHTLNGRFTAVDAPTHVHLDPATQDEQTIATVRTLFDTVARRDGDGWTVRKS